MSTATDFLSELSLAKSFEEVRVLGYTEYLSLPNLSPEERFEIQEALSFSAERVAKLGSVIASLTILIEDGYPTREKQEAPDLVIEALRNKLRAMEIAFNEFDAETTAEIIFSEV